MAGKNNSLSLVINLGEMAATLDIGRVRAELKAVMDGKSYYPELERKPRSKRLRENLAWYFKHGEVNRFYNEYGLDVVGFRDSKDVLPYREFRIERNLTNLAPHFGVYNRVCLLRDKAAFGFFFANMLGEGFVPAFRGIIRADGAIDLKDGYGTLRELLRATEKPVFLKKIDGECGDGVYKASLAGIGNLSINNAHADEDEFLETLKGSEYIVQEAISQHEMLDVIYPGCANTIRIVTVVGRSGVPHVLESILRFGQGGAINDNWATGGFIVPINEDGTLQEYGFYNVQFGTRVNEHPDTKVRFGGLLVPFWDEVQELVIKAHKYVPEIRYIGWDVAITPDRPMLLEGNDNLEINALQIVNNLKTKWYKLINS